MIALLKYIKGYLRIKVWGFSPERFMNLCSNKNILLWDIAWEGDTYYMNISLKGFYELKDIARKTGTRVAICKRYGLPFFMPTLFARKVFVLGLVLTIGFWMWSSYYIWDIEIQGNYQITEDVFERFLKQNAVTIGMPKAKLDIELLEKQIRKNFTQITWTSAKLSGTKLTIDVKENDAPIIIAKEEKETGSDLIAEYEGTIVSMIVRKGIPQVAIGDTVEKGRILVDGKVPIYNEDSTIKEYQYVNADADIELEHNRKFHATLPFDYIQKEYTGRKKKKYFLLINGKEWKIPESRPFLLYDSIIRTSQPLAFEKLSIPVYIGCYTHREYVNVEYEYSLEQAKNQLNQKINTFITTLQEKGVQIIEKNVKIDTKGGKWTIDGLFLVRELVGVSKNTVKLDVGEQELNE